MPRKTRACASVVVGLVCVLSSCDDPTNLTANDGGLAVSDAGHVIDSGVLDAGDASVDDAGVVDAGAGCFFSPVDPVPYTPDGSEDYTDDTPGFHPEMDVVATWSRIEGADVVVEVRFAAPPFRVELPDYNGSLELGFFVDPADPGLPMCDSAEQTNCAFPDRLLGISDSPDLGRGWPPDVICIITDNSSPCELVEDLCEHAFVTPTEPYLRLRVPADSVGVDVTSTYVLRASHNGVFVSWGTEPADVIEMRGGSAPAMEPFVSVCAIPCPP